MGSLAVPACYIGRSGSEMHMDRQLGPRRAEGVAYDHGIESGAGPTLCALEIGGCGELGLKIGLSLGSSRGEG